MKVFSLVLVIVAINTKQLLAGDPEVNLKKLILAVIEPYLDGLPLEKIVKDLGENLNKDLLNKFVEKFVPSTDRKHSRLFKMKRVIN